MNVLVVDDDVSVRESVSKVLESVGYTVSLAADGPDALDLFGAGGVDLVILDIGLPTKNGWQTLEQIAARSPGTPVILITGQSDQFESAAVPGFGALMEKPLDVVELLRTVALLLSETNEARLRRKRSDSHEVRYLQLKRGKSAGRIWEPKQLRFRSSIWRNSIEH